MRQMVAEYKGIMRTMDYASGWSGAKIQNVFDPVAIGLALAKFYKDFQEKTGFDQCL